MNLPFLSPIHPSPVDIWCLGIILYIMIHGYFPFETSKPDDLNFKDLQEGSFGVEEREQLGDDFFSIIYAIFRSFTRFINNRSKSKVIN